MLIAGEASGDMLAAELVRALRAELTAADVSYTPDSQPLHTGLEPRFFGAGGPRMAAAGVELAFDLTEHSIIGIPSPKSYLASKRRFDELVQLALERQPDVIIGIDYNYFNLKFAETIRQYTGRRAGWFHDWRPKIVKYVSPQVWSSRAGRAYEIARDFDLLLSIFPFEKDWYARKVPELRVEFIGHPMVERFLNAAPLQLPATTVSAAPRILLLPGSRPKEIQRHLPVMLGALEIIREKFPQCSARIVLPDQKLAERAKSLGVPPEVGIQIGKLSEALTQADVAIASTGTVAMECAFFGVPTVTLYKTFWATFEVGKRIATVKWLTMPNLLADAEVFPEFIQNAATAENLSHAALDLLQNESRRAALKRRLAEIISTLGGPGASERAAQAIGSLLKPDAGENS